MTDVLLALILVTLAVVVSRTQGLGLESELIVCVLRAVVQLGALTAVIQVVFDYLGLAGLLLGVMLVAAAITSGRRLSGVPGARRLAALTIGASAAVAMVVLFGTRVFPFEPQYLIPVGGMLIGNSMTAVSLAGARLRDEITDKVLEIESRLALGVPARTALRPYARRAATGALIPTIDSTKNVGLIFLPGAFVGMMLAGASPAEAASVQLVVLFMLLGAVSVAGLLTTILVARAYTAPGERILLPLPPSER
ncbi:MAG: ABC transporter permease [Actinomycetota bacterium]